jgi:hypothetical protein
MLLPFEIPDAKIPQSRVQTLPSPFLPLPTIVSNMFTFQKDNHSDGKFRMIWLRHVTKEHETRPVGSQTSGGRKAGRGLAALRAYRHDPLAAP